MKNLLFIQTRAPYGSLAGQEGLDALLMGSTFAPCTVLFLGDGVFQLVANQAPDAIGRKPFSKGFGALREYGVERICAAANDLAQRGLDVAGLGLEIESLNTQAVKNLIARSDVVLSF